jgi:hypothetical protein
MAQHDSGAPHPTPDDEYLPVAGSSYEHTDANVWAVAKFGFWLVVMALIVHFGMGLMYAVLIDQATETGQQRYPLAVSGEARLPPEPRLQQSPEAEILAYRSAQARRLASYGWVDKEAGTLHIPIAEAMRLTVERGLPARAVEPDQPEAGMLASDASAGRVMERRRQ